jgi:hypothetical protein
LQAPVPRLEENNKSRRDPGGNLNAGQRMRLAGGSRRRRSSATALLDGTLTVRARTLPRGPIEAIKPIDTRISYTSRQKCEPCEPFPEKTKVDALADVSSSLRLHDFAYAARAHNPAQTSLHAWRERRVARRYSWSRHVQEVVEVSSLWPSVKPGQ